MITVTCRVCEQDFKIDVPQRIWDAELAARCAWAYNWKPTSVSAAVLAKAAVADIKVSLDPNTEELLLYRICEKCWEDDSDD